jgi:hypothetical protein
MIHGAPLETTAKPAATTSRIVSLMDNTRKNPNHVSTKPGTVADDSNAALVLLMLFRLPMATGSDRTKTGLGTSSTLQTKIGR